MSHEHESTLSPQEVGERFDRLAAETREYAVFLVEPGGTLLCWNPGAEHLFGYRSDEVIGQHFSRFFSPEDVRSGQPEHELKTASDDGRSDSIRWQVRKDGTRFWCQSVVTPLYDEKKQARSFARVMHDLTEIEAAQVQTRRADGLAEANRSREEFMALLSHELRSPLSPIRNALSIMRQMRTTDPIIEQAGNIIDRQVGVMVTANAHSWGSCVDLRVVARGSITWAVVLAPPAHAVAGPVRSPVMYGNQAGHH